MVTTHQCSRRSAPLALVIQRKEVGFDRYTQRIRCLRKLPEYGLAADHHDCIVASDIRSGAEEMLELSERHGSSPPRRRLHARSATVLAATGPRQTGLTAVAPGPARYPQPGRRRSKRHRAIGPPAIDRHRRGRDWLQISSCALAPGRAPGLLRRDKPARQSPDDRRCSVSRRGDEDPSVWFALSGESHVPFPTLYNVHARVPTALRSHRAQSRTDVLDLWIWLPRVAAAVDVAVTR